jgi:uncharacterized transporter YbjL
MKLYFKPFLFSFIPSILVVFITLIITFNWDKTIGLLTGDTTGPHFFRGFLLLLEIIFYFILLKLFTDKELENERNKSMSGDHTGFVIYNKVSIRTDKKEVDNRMSADGEHRIAGHMRDIIKDCKLEVTTVQDSDILSYCYVKSEILVNKTTNQILINL